MNREETAEMLFEAHEKQIQESVDLRPQLRWESLNGLSRLIWLHLADVVRAKCYEAADEGFSEGWVAAENSGYRLVEFEDTRVYRKWKS